MINEYAIGLNLLKILTEFKILKKFCKIIKHEFLNLNKKKYKRCDGSPSSKNFEILNFLVFSIKTAIQLVVD